MYHCHVDFNCHWARGMCVNIVFFIYNLSFPSTARSLTKSFLSKCPKYCHLGGGGGGLLVDA